MPRRRARKGRGSEADASARPRYRFAIAIAEVLVDLAVVCEQRRGQMAVAHVLHHERKGPAVDLLCPWGQLKERALYAGGRPAGARTVRAR
jgi:hypothetical protein